jgi:hypothetical protein
MDRALRRIVLCCALASVMEAVISAGCSSSSGAVSIEQACADLASARCQKMQTCNLQGIVNAYGDLTSCESRQTATCVTNLGAPQSANSASHTEDCAQAIPAEACSDFELGNVAPACQPPPGPRAVGTPCSVNAQCASAFCLFPKTSTCGTCATAPAVGASCANNGCGPGLVCDSHTQLCAMPVGSGGGCDDSSVCAPGLTCIGNTATDSGTCVALATSVGAACDLADAGTRCDGRLGLYCNVREGRRCDRIGEATPTLACGTIDGGLIDCSAGAFCQFSGFPPSGICIAPDSEGLPCDTLNGPLCSVPARCVLSDVGGTTGTCRTTDPAACN